MALFTQSYLDNNNVEVNPFEQYIENAILIKAKTRVASSEKTTEAKEAERQGYVFAAWINISQSIALYVKPSKEITEYRETAFVGYRPTALMFNGFKDSVRLVLHVQEIGGIHYSHTAIAGDADASEFFQGLKNLLTDSDYFPLFSEKYNIA